jgi:hypothetical protein
MVHEAMFARRHRVANPPCPSQRRPLPNGTVKRLARPNREPALRVVRSPWLVASCITVSLAALTGCSASELNTDAGGPTTVKASTTNGTTKSGATRSSGFAASLVSASDPRAAAVGALIDIRVPATNETTTTVVTVVETVPETLPPVVVTTQKPVVTVAPTLPPTTTPTVTLPPVTIPQGKPVPQPMNGGLSADEQGVLNAMNAARAAAGLGPLVPEINAMQAARQHNTPMAAANGLPYSITTNLFDVMPVAYQQLGQVEGYYPGAYVDPIKSQVSAYSAPYVYVGIGINKNPGGGVWYWTIIIGQ